MTLQSYEKFNRPLNGFSERLCFISEKRVSNAECENYLRRAML